MNSTGIDVPLFALALGELPVGIVVVDAAGEVARTSGRARELLGDDVSVLDETFAVALAGEEAHTSVEAGGRTISVDAQPLRDAGDAIVGAVALVQDVSEQRRREQAERDFIANAAHELRTPLAAIASAIDVLEQGAKEVPEERDLFLSHVAQQSDRLERVIGALLAIARYDAGVEQPKLEIVPVHRLLTAVANSLVSASGVKVVVRCRKDIAVLANGGMLEEALANVAENAVRYTERGSVVLACRSDGNTAVFTVKDTGPGIPREDVEHVFERFFRSGNRDARGFGLGLPIARRAVEASGGEIRLAAEEGKGTVVEIRLPLAQLVEPS